MDIIVKGSTVDSHAEESCRIISSINSGSSVERSDDGGCDTRSRYAKLKIVEAIIGVAIIAQLFIDPKFK